MSELELIYPNVYSKRKRRLQDEFLVVTKLNFFEFCKIANRQFEYLLKNEHKPGMHFIDWRISFHNLYGFVSNFKNGKSSIFYHHEIERFLYYYTCSADLIYKRDLS